MIGTKPVTEATGLLNFVVRQAVGERCMLDEGEPEGSLDGIQVRIRA